ncbi:fungal-specific transcription factor domain-containing protein [Aspergillus pseudotamarii]|uniref:Fungal-specific transcription factor domain-containing protein n=1 Tax=Aspergillus pseudotamarii TaxID=132259 RepID=A0A5N6SXY2_ASPPS|nr:fungal-specific transcription factor domain-containing protein [Aspergillus pseudotamarii]KAE8138610.1 fungal-specific transcription factor domain-containing protein [Aspergillus pseudotamarii]
MAGGTESPRGGILPSHVQRTPKNPVIVAYLWDSTAHITAHIIVVRSEKDMSASPRERQQLGRTNFARPQGTEGQQQLEVDDKGDASAHTFLSRVYSHLKSMGQSLPRNLSRPAEEVLSEHPLKISLIPLDRRLAEEYIDCFHSHSCATYRYITRSQSIEFLGKLYSEDESFLQDDASMAVILLILAVGCIWYPSLHNRDLFEYKTKASRLYEAAQSRLEKTAFMFPPSILVMQAHCLKCQFLLAVNIFNSAWLAVGTAVRLGQIVGFHKAKATGSNSRDEFTRRGVFWSLYIMDRYLSAALGRPIMINDDDITIPYPDAKVSSSQGIEDPHEAKTVPGIVAHIKLAQITSQVLRRLYGSKKHDKVARDESVSQIEAQLSNWSEETPGFFNPEEQSDQKESEVFYDVPWIFKRQQRTIRAAFFFTFMQLYRGYLLDEFLQANFHDRSALAPAPQVQKCIQAALQMALLAAEIKEDVTYNAVFWTTSYFTFCAISILTVYLTLYPEIENRAVIENVLERAIEGHRKLDNSMNKHSQRLLEDTRAIAQRAFRSSRTRLSTSGANDRTAIMLNDANASVTVEQPIPPPGSGYPRVERREEWEDTQGVVDNIDEAPIPGLNELADIVNGDDLGFIMNIGFDASPLNDVDPLQSFVADKFSRPGPQA